MAKIDFSKKMTTLDGEPLLFGLPVCPTCNKLQGKRLRTLRNVSIEALMTTIQQDTQLSGEEKVRRYQLALQINNQDVIDLSLDDRKLLRDRIALLYGPLIVGQAWPMLDPE